MCGIAGIITRNSQPDLRGLISRMSASIAHRGPDGEGFLLSDGTGATPYSGSIPVNVDPRFNYLPAHPLSAANTRGKRIAFAHRRLSILDLSTAGHCPMGDASGRLWITYN